MNCIACNSATTEWNELGLFHCENCGHSTLSNPEPNPYLHDSSLTDKFCSLDKEPISKHLSALRLGFVRSSGKKTGVLVDIGCSVGTFMSMASQYGYKSYGFDISESAVNVAYKKGLRVYLEDAESLNGNFPQADVVTMFDVIEHLKHPDKTISYLSSNLAKDSVIILSTPNANCIGREVFRTWRHYKPSEHIHYFTEQSIMTLLENSGFKVVELHCLESLIRENKDRPFDNILTVIARKE